jgi:hypothetical protein
MANGQIKGAGNVGKGARIGYYEAERVGNNLTVTEVELTVGTKEECNL